MFIKLSCLDSARVSAWNGRHYYFNWRCALPKSFKKVTCSSNLFGSICSSTDKTVPLPVGPGCTGKTCRLKVKRVGLIKNRHILKQIYIFFLQYILDFRALQNFYIIFNNRRFIQLIIFWCNTTSKAFLICPSVSKYVCP